VQEEFPDVLDAVLTNVKIRAVFGGLSREAAKLMVEEMFVNQLDLKEVKKAIYQTKFWPTYSRDKVYTHQTGHTTGGSTTHTTAIGQATQFSYDSEGWFGGSSTTDSNVMTSGAGGSYADTESESVADVPIFIPVPFKELSSVEYWPLEEQIFRMSDSLKAQFPRHCFIQIPEKKTQPMLVPLVKEFRLFPEDVASYQRELYGQAKALPVGEVDSLLDAERGRLKKEAMEYLAAASADEKANAETVGQKKGRGLE
jgi:hypothetical protein